MHMKNHQFAIEPVKFSQMIHELKVIHFYNDQMSKLSPALLFKHLLFKAFVNDHSQALKNFRLHGLMATPDQAADNYLDSTQNLSTSAFYNVALQLWHFEVHLDFELDAPLKAMKKMRLPMVKVANPKAMTNKDVLHAWYLMLNTHTKLGQTYLDDLASDGYYKQFNDLPKPLFIDGKAQPVFNTNHLIHEVVYVESPLDTDKDGERDLLKTDIIRPSETNHGVKVPTLFTASPYNMGTNDADGDRMTHNVNKPLTRKQPNNYTYQDVESHADPTKNIPAPRAVKGHAKQPEQAFHHEWTYTMNDYFLARGFAVVYSAGVGTLGSQGLKTTGDKAETVSAESVVQWLAGNRTAFTNPSDHIAIDAWWSNHNVAMTGRSYLGTLATAVASTGVKGLKTCIIEAAISSWYDYYRENGLVCAAGGFQGEDADVLAEEVFSRKKSAGDYHRIKPLWKKQLAKITHDQHRDTGAYNKFWDARNYLKDLKNTKADLLFVHGLNDINVKPINVEHSWKALKDVPVTKKLILHQGQHIYINNFQSIDFTDMVNLWISNKLYGVDNSANQLIPPVTVQDNTKPETWNTYKDWCNSQHHITYHLNDQSLDPESCSQAPLSFKDYVDKKSFAKYCHYLPVWYHDLMSSKKSPLTGNKLIFKTAPFKHDLKVDGNVKVNLRVKSSQDIGLISAMLVDYGTAKCLTISPQVIGFQSIYQGYHWHKDDLREFKYQKHPTPFKKIVVSHINLQNRHNAYKVDDLKPNQYVDVSFELQPTFFHFLPKHQLGLIIFATDYARTLRGNQHISYTIDPKYSSLVVPVYKK